MISHLFVAKLAVSAFVIGAAPTACELVDQTSAELVLGSGATNVDGGAEASMCMYQGADGALLIVQVFDRGWYDTAPIIPPRTDVSIGERGRYNEESTGKKTVQFVKSDATVGLSVTPTAESHPDLLRSLLEAARIAAGRIP